MNYCFLFLLWICYSIPTTSYCQIIDFETAVPANWSSSLGTLSMSNTHYKLGNESLSWNWVSNDTILITVPNINPADVLHFYKHTTELWVYNEIASNEHIRFEYLDGSNVVNYYYDFILNFEGWRRVSRSYKYDMHAIVGATTSIASIRILSPTSGSGQLYFDDWEYVKNRYSRIRNHQMPDIAGYLSNTSYWTIDNYTPDIPLTTATASELADIATIRSNILNSFQGGAPSSGQMANADNFYNSLNIVVSGNQIKGKHTSPPDADVFLLTYARDYYHNGTASSLAKAEEIIWLINDAGYAAGSDLVYGWYNTRNYFTGLILIYNALNPRLQVKIFDAIAWTFRMDEFWDTAPLPGFDSDFVHTNLRFELGAIVVCINNNDSVVQQLKGFKRFLERKNIPSSNTRGWLKPDHTSFHHNAHYNAYMYSFSSYTAVLNYLKNTQFQINQTAYETFRDAAYAFLIFCNGNHYANSLSGRHPFSTNLGMSKGAYNQLAYIGGSILGQAADPIIAGAYNRIWNDDAGLSGYVAEIFPEGYWQFNYSPIGIYRQDNWVATLHGINKTFWGTEIYSNANRYGRYQSYGAIEIMYPGGRDSSGMTRDGFDWNKQPGTTSKMLSWTDLNPSGARADERAKSDYAAALRFEGNTDELKGSYGMYGFDFQQRAISGTHDESFQFKKSMFCFDSLIICLGSNIRCNDLSNPIVTTLFQNKLTDPTRSVVTDNIAQTNFPFAANLGVGKHWVLDPWSTGYYINTTDSIFVDKKHQISPNQTGNTTTTGNFASAWIQHGTAPNNSSYEFVVLPNRTPPQMNDFGLKMQNRATQPYEITQQDSAAHIIYHKNSKIHAYAFFESNTNLTDSILKSNDAPCLVMLREQNGVLQLSLVDPSTSFLQNKIIQLVLKGEYVLQNGDSGITVLTSANNQTVLTFEPRDGAPQDVTLINLRPNGNILSNQFLNFNAKKASENSTVLKWKIDNEQNIVSYSVERSADAINWKLIGQVAAKNQAHTYQFYDKTPLTKNNYYRIKQLGVNNQINYSLIEVVFFDARALFSVYPNPNNGQFYISTEIKGNYNVSILDANGKVVFLKENNGAKMLLNIPNLPAGVYTVQLQTGATFYYSKITII